MAVTPVLAASIALRIGGVGYSLALLYRSRDRRFGFFTLMLSLMASRQVWTALSTTTTGLSELPGLIVSVLAVTTVHYLARYVEEEDRIKTRLRETNERLRDFRKAVEHAGHAIFLTDTDGTIEYANPAVETVTGYPPAEVVGENPNIWKSGEHEESFYADLWETITSGEVWDGEIINENRNGDLRWVDMTIAPITDEDGDVDRFVAVDTDVTERKERELRINEQNERLARLNETNAVLREINQLLVQADDRDEVERAICEEFAETDTYDAAWIASRNMVNDAVRARARAGIDEEDLRGAVEALNAAGTTAVDRALAGDGTSFALPAETSEPGVLADFPATLAIPLTYRDSAYGALVVHASDPEAVDVVDTSVLDELGETIAYAVNAIESKRSLIDDRLTEMTFQLDDGDGVLFDMAATHGADLELERLSMASDGDLIAYVSVDGVDVEAVLADADSRPAIRSAGVVSETDDGAVFRLVLSGSTVVETVVDQGCAVRSLAADADGGQVTAAVSRTGDVQTIVEGVRQCHPDADLVAQREHERSVETRGEFRATIEDRLTARQLEAVATAHFAGYFEWPRGASGEEVASLMDISQSTFVQHLRAAERKVFDELLDRTSEHEIRARARPG